MISLCLSSLQDALRCDFETAIHHASELGFRFIDLSLRHVTDVSSNLIASVIANHGVQIASVHDAYARNVVIFSAKGTVTEEFHASLVNAMQIANDLGAKIVNLGLGSTRRYPPCMTAESASESYVKAVENARSCVLNLSTKVSIEVCSYQTGGFIRNATECMSAIRGYPDLTATIDTHHCSLANLDPVDELSICGRRTSMIHVSNPGRQPPGPNYPLWPSLFSYIKNFPNLPNIAIECNVEKDQLFKLNDSLVYLSELTNG